MYDVVIETRTIYGKGIILSTLMGTGDITRTLKATIMSVGMTMTLVII